MKRREFIEKTAVDQLSLGLSLSSFETSKKNS
jgi:hypothetical protein